MRWRVAVLAQLHRLRRSCSFSHPCVAKVEAQLSLSARGVEGREGGGRVEAQLSLSARGGERGGGGEMWNNDWHLVACHSATLTVIWCSLFYFFNAQSMVYIVCT